MTSKLIKVDYMKIVAENVGRESSTRLVCMVMKFVLIALIFSRLPFLKHMYLSYKPRKGTCEEINVHRMLTCTKNFPKKRIYTFHLGQ